MAAWARSSLAGHIGMRHRPLFDRPERLAGHAIEHPQKSLLAGLRHHVHRLAVVLHRQQLRRGGIVVIPNVVMDHLEMPQAFAGARVQRQQAVGEQIRAVAIDAVEIVLRARRWARRRCRASRRPTSRSNVGAAHGLPCILRPGVVSELAGMRNGVKGPHQLSRAHIESADVAGRRVVLLHWWRSRESADSRTRGRAWWIAPAQRLRIAVQTLLQIDAAVVAER